MVSLNILTNYEYDDIKMNATQAIQRAIDQCAQSGGGEVVIPGVGDYIIDGIQLKSGVILRLERDAALIGSGDESKYYHRPGPFELLANETPIASLIYAKNATNIGITGGGTIDGNYEKFIYPNQEGEEHLKFFKYPRPMMVYFEGCSHINISKVRLVHAPFWTIHLVGCVQTEIDSINIKNEMRMPNTDGIDIDRCKQTLIHDSQIVTGDDGICPKCTEETAQYGNCYDIKVARCRIVTRSSAIKFGSSSFGDFENCYFSDITIEDTNRGIAFQLRDPGSARNITFENISIKTKTFTKEWWGSGEPIYITIVPRDKGTAIDDQVIENITFLNVDCQAGNGILGYSTAKRAIRNIHFENVKLQLTEPFKSKTNFDLRPTADIAKITDSHVGLNINGIENLVLENVTLQDVNGEVIKY